MAQAPKDLTELVAELIIEQKETRRELVQVFNTGFMHLADQTIELKAELTQVKDDVRSIDRRLGRFEDEQLLPRLVDLEHRLSIVERKVA